MRTEPMSFRLTPAEHKLLKTIAKSKGKRPAQWVQKVIRAELRKFSEPGVVEDDPEEEKAEKEKERVSFWRRFIKRRKNKKGGTHGKIRR